MITERRRDLRPKIVQHRLIDRRLAEAWDRDVALRHVELAAHIDVAYYALIERIAAVIRASYGDSANILDVGCGLGVLTARLANQGYKVTGIDISRRSIVQARSDFGRVASFRVANVSRLPRDLTRRFDVVVACMVWHNHPRLDAVVAGCRAALKDNGSLVATVAEPQSYLIKQGVHHRYETPKRFDFPLRHTHCCGTHMPVPYYHRPVKSYFTALRRNCFEGVSIASDAAVSLLPQNDVVTFIGSATSRRNTTPALERESGDARKSLRSRSPMQGVILEGARA